MSRCAICDYSEGLSKSFAVTNSNGRVRWRSTHNEYQCDDCFNTVRNSQLHWDDPDLEEGEIETLEEDDEE